MTDILNLDSISDSEDRPITQQQTGTEATTKEQVVTMLKAIMAPIPGYSREQKRFALYQHVEAKPNEDPLEHQQPAKKTFRNYHKSQVFMTLKLGSTFEANDFANCFETPEVIQVLKSFKALKQFIVLHYPT